MNRLIPLGSQTRAATGFSHKLILDWSDIKTWTSGTGQAVVPTNTLGSASITLPANSLVGRFTVNVVTAFAASALSITTFTFSLGDGGSATRFVNAIDLLTAGMALGTTTAYLYAAADTIDAKATFTLSAHTIAELTAGQVEVYFDLVDMSGIVNVGTP